MAPSRKTNIKERRKNLVMDYFGIQPKVEYSGGEQVKSEGEIRSALAIPGEPINDGDLPF